MKHWNRLLALGLSLGLLTACSDQQSEPTAEPTVEPTAEVSQLESTGETVRVSMLKGPTGLGAAKLMAEAEEETTANGYGFQVFAEPTQAVAALSKGEVDIAALPTNLASTLYNKDESIQLLALNTRGVLYILENGETVNSIADLAGKTLYATGQGANPEYVLNYLLEQNDLTPGEDVEIQWMASDELSTALAAGEVELAMLPVPAATSVMLQNSSVRSAVSLNEAWTEAEIPGVMTMGCVVARKDYVEAHPDAVAAFMVEYGRSVSFMSDEANLDEAAQLAETYGIVPKAAVAKKALPDANLCFITGDDMMDGIQGYYQVLYQADPKSIGGSIPDGAFYYMGVKADA